MANVKPVQLGKTTRMSFSKINEVLDMPNLIEVQKNSYQWFLDHGCLLYTSYQQEKPSHRADQQFFHFGTKNPHRILNAFPPAAGV